MIDTDIAAAVGHDALSNEDRDSPIDIDELALDSRAGDDGWPEVRFRGEWHPVPTYGDIEDWIFDVSSCEAPDGSSVEPDDPNSWLSLLGLI